LVSFDRPQLFNPIRQIPKSVRDQLLRLIGHVGRAQASQKLLGRCTPTCAPHIEIRCLGSQTLGGLHSELICPRRVNPLLPDAFQGVPLISVPKVPLLCLGNSSG
jgi:hypothetical protein